MKVGKPTTTSDLDKLLATARAASPGTRIEYRDAIASHGADAISALRCWLVEPGLGAFATRTLEKIAAEPANKQAVVDALAAANGGSMAPSVAGDVADALARLRGPRRTAGSVPRSQPPKADWPGPRRVSALEWQFHEDMLDIFRLAGEATRRPHADGSVIRGYWAVYFLRGVRNHGGPDYARQLLHMTGTTPGFQRLADEGHLELTVEALVLRPEYTSLFAEEELRVAAHRLAEAGYQPARNG